MNIDEARAAEHAKYLRAYTAQPNNRPSFNKAGDDLHINKRPYEQWDALFRAWFPGTVTWIKGKRHYVSEGWRIDL